MTNRSLYGAWKQGNDSAGDLVLPGNHGGGYGAQTIHFFKMHDGSGTAITDAKTGVTSGAAAGLSWDAANGSLIGATSGASPTFTITDPVATQDFIFICVTNLTSSSASYSVGGLGFDTGFQFDGTDLTFKNSVGAITFTPTKPIPIGENVSVYINIDDSAATLAWGWVSATDSNHEAAAAFAGGSATAFTDKFNFALSENYSLFMGYYTEPAASLAVIKEAAAFHLAQHTSNECKADPTKRIVYPGLI